MNIRKLIENAVIFKLQDNKKTPFVVDILTKNDEHILIKKDLYKYTICTHFKNKIKQYFKSKKMNILISTLTYDDEHCKLRATINFK